VQLSRAVSRAAERLVGRIAMTSLCAPLPADAGDSVTLTIADESTTRWRTLQRRITGNQQYERYRDRAAEPPALPGIHSGQLGLSSSHRRTRIRGRSGIMRLPRQRRYLRSVRSIRSSPRTCRSAVTPSPPHCRMECPTGCFDRCIQFARDGWSVVWFVDHGQPHDARRERIGRLVDRLIGAAASLSIRELVRSARMEALCSRPKQNSIRSGSRSTRRPPRSSCDCLCCSRCGGGAAPPCNLVQRSCG